MIEIKIIDLYKTTKMAEEKETPPDPFPIPGMVFAKLVNPDTTEYVLEYHIKKSLGARLGMKRSEISDDMLAMPEPLIKMLNDGPLAPPDGTPEDESKDPYVKATDDITEVLELFPSKALDTIAKLTITNNGPMSRAEFLKQANARVAIIAKCFQIWIALHGGPHTTPFLFLGHGEENPVEFEARRKLPDGYTLVTFAKCGVSTYTSKIGAFLEWTKKNQDHSMNPANYSKEIGEVFGVEIRVYRGGDLYPPLIYTPALFHYSLSDMYLRPSGLHLLPLIVENRMATPIKINKDERLDMPKALSVYGGALYPSADNLIDKSPVDLLKIKLPIETIFEKFGPGVYYWPICRSISKAEESLVFTRRRAMSNAQQEERKRTEGRLGGRRRRHKTRRLRKNHTRKNVHRF